jgi:hypothetical protein
VRSLNQNPNPRSPFTVRDDDDGRNSEISDADMLKYTGKTKDELKDWAKDRQGGSQFAGKINMNHSTRLGVSKQHMVRVVKVPTLTQDSNFHRNTKRAKRN